MAAAPSSAAARERLAALGPIVQLAYVPLDFDGALQRWLALGAGPFWLWDHLQVDHLVHRGDTVKADFSVAIAYWGDIQIELIRQHDDGPTIYRDWNSDALHHVMIAAPDYESALELCEKQGFPVAMHGRGLLGSPDTRFAYCDLGRGGPAGYVEFASSPPGAGGLAERRAALKAIAETWDGVSEPLRPLF
jgi:hypothetical protein